jgi:hypothetical protein
MSRVKNLYFSMSSPSALEARLASYPMGICGSLPVGKRPGSEKDHSFQTTAEVKKSWIYISSPRMYSWRSAMSIRYRDNFTSSTFQDYFILFLC